MTDTIITIGNLDNTNTLFENVISLMYPEELRNEILIRTILLRNNFLSMIKDFLETEHTIVIKEFSGSIPMAYNESSTFNFGLDELSTDFIIITEAYKDSLINETIENIEDTYLISLEALNTNIITKNTWDNYLDSLYLDYLNNEGNPRIRKIMIENIVQLFEKWDDLENITMFNFLKEYNNSHNISYDEETYWQEPIYTISKKYWEKFSFVLTINDFDLYDESKEHYLDIISDKYFNNGYADELIIKMNYLYWYDDFQKILDWINQKLKSVLVSYRFDTLITNDTKNRYFNDIEASLYGDIQRKNTLEEEMVMFKERLLVFKNKFLTHPTTYGFELTGGYFGNEGNLMLSSDSDDFDLYKDEYCHLLSSSPFSKVNDNIKIISTNELKKHVFFCVKGK